MVTAELPPDCGSPALLQPICSASLAGDGDRSGGGPRQWVPTGYGEGGRGGQPPPSLRELGGAQPSRQGIKIFCAWKTGSVCE